MCVTVDRCDLRGLVGGSPSQTDQGRDWSADTPKKRTFAARHWHFKREPWKFVRRLCTIAISLKLPSKDGRSSKRPMGCRRADSHFGLAKLLMRLLEIDIKDLSEAEAAVQLLGAVLPKARFVRRIAAARPRTGSADSL